ncbi:MAG: hypothetical protein JWP81_5269 [Ferruginibacter sp.]|nr:hypothetical protein [Ferruginibacter sp.]
MTKLFTLLAASLFAMSVTAQNAVVASNTQSPGKEIPNASKTVTDDVLVLKEPEFDFGKIPQGKPVTHIFEVSNNGKDSLNIINVQASCGCTTPEWERGRVVAPGEKTNITVGYNAAAEGKFTKLVTITYNGTLSKQIVIKGDVWKTPVTSAPENKALGNLKD